MKHSKWACISVTSLGPLGFISLFFHKTACNLFSRFSTRLTPTQPRRLHRGERVPMFRKLIKTHGLKHEGIIFGQEKLQICPRMLPLTKQQTEENSKNRWTYLINLCKGWHIHRFSSCSVCHCLSYKTMVNIYAKNVHTCFFLSK